MAFNAFIEENPTMVGISERALRPLINGQDPDIRANVIQKIGMCLSKGQYMSAENVKWVIEWCKEHKGNSGRPIKKSNETIIAQVEGADIEGGEMDLPCATCTHVCIPATKELDYESVEEKLTLFVEYLLSLGIETSEIKAKFLKVLDTF